MTLHALDSCGSGYPWSDRLASHEAHYDPETDRQPLESFAWPGGYPILYVSEDGGTFCGRHAWAVIVREDVPMGRDIFYEGPDEWCDEGSHPIESAYGDPDASEDDGPDHKHRWGPIEYARMTGNPHRRCLDWPDCDAVSLDLDDEEATA